MSFYKTCPLCGASLDPGEICDCQESQAHEKSAAKRKRCSRYANTGSSRERNSYQAVYPASLAESEAHCQEGISIPDFSVFTRQENLQLLVLCAVMEIRRSPEQKGAKIAFLRQQFTQQDLENCLTVLQSYDSIPQKINTLMDSAIIFLKNSVLPSPEERVGAL